MEPSVSEIENSTSELSNDSQTIMLDYKAIAGSYYRLVSDKVRNPTKGFNEFLDDYYTSNYDSFFEYFVQFGVENNLAINEIDSRLSTYWLNSLSRSNSRSEDEDYILSAIDDEGYTPQATFKREPFYLFYDYSYIFNGDIIYETETIANVGHNALIVDTHHDSYYGYYIQTIEAVLNGVQFGFLDDLPMIDFKVKILRVFGSTGGIINDAIYFARYQLGDDYVPSTIITSIDSDIWNCSMLVYASYLYGGINICERYIGGIYFCPAACIPSDIWNGARTYQVSSSNASFFTFSIVGKSGINWHLKVYNANPVDLVCVYNTKMCFPNDATHWSGLNDLTTVVVQAYCYVDLVISENWFATSVVSSFILSNYRHITYADGLNLSTQSLTNHYSYFPV